MAKLPPVPLAPSERIARFLSRHTTHGKGQFVGEPFTMERWQREDFVEPVFDQLHPVRRSGGTIMLRDVTEGFLGVAKKNGKSTLAAGLGAYALYADGYYSWDLETRSWVWRREYGAEVFNVAGSKEQAKVLFDMAAAMVNRSPMLRHQSRVFRDAIEVRDTESVWRVIAADARLAHGPSPSVAIIDEIWTHRDPELYEAFASAGAARIQPLLVTITTAGWDKDTIAYRLYRRGQHRKRARSFFFRWYEAPAGSSLDDHEATKQANPSSWVTVDYLKAELQRARDVGDEAQFSRWHRNQWTAGQDIAIPEAVWMLGATRPHIPKDSAVTVAIDAAPKHDTTALAIDHVDDKGVHNVRVAFMHADPATGYLDFVQLEDLVRDVCRTFKVKRVLVDPAFMTRSMLLLAGEDIPMEEFPQTDLRMVPACLNFYSLLTSGRVRHGDPAELHLQALSAGRRIAGQDRGWRFDKRKSSGHIDGIVALAMATYEAERGMETGPAPFMYV